MKQLPVRSQKLLDACGKTTQIHLWGHPAGCGGSSLMYLVLQEQENLWAAKNISKPVLAS